MEQPSAGNGIRNPLEYSWVLSLPVQIVEDAAVLALVILVLVIIWKNQDRVIFLLTGDDRIHGTPADFIWWSCCRCCGTCSHEWTRILTSFPCCPRGIRGANLVKAFSAAIGLATHTVEISNIVVGDLPFNRNGDFYLSVECAQNPPMKTALAENQRPKTVHFPEVITLKIRESALDPPVKIKVLELNLVGSYELCELNLSSLNVVGWARDNREKLKRFMMLPCDRSMEVPTPPWIAMEFDFPRQDIRQLDQLYDFAGGTVRTGNFSMERTGGNVGAFQDTRMADFKHKYTLVDTHGHIVKEPAEDDLACMQCMRRCVRGMLAVVTLIVTWLVLGLAMLRLYLANCYAQYRLLHMGLHGAIGQVTSPISTAVLVHIDKFCTTKLDGTGVKDGQDVCRPSFEQVIKTCHNLPSTELNSRPEAFSDALRSLGMDISFLRKVLTCPAEACDWYPVFKDWDRPIFASCFILLVFTWTCLRPLANHCVDVWRRGLMERHNEVMQRHNQFMLSSLRG